MTAPYRRGAAAALDEARPAVDRLDISRDAEDVAADLIEAWEAAQRALRGLLGASSLSGQALIRDLRMHNLLTLDQGHALIDFASAAERAHRTDYQPTSADIDAARAGFQQLESAILHGPPRPADAPRVTGPISTPEAAAEKAAPLGPGPYASEPAATPASTDWAKLGLLIAIALVILGAIGGMGWALWSRGAADRTLARAQEAYRTGDRSTARTLFAQVVREKPDLALPHIYLGRMAREEGDVTTAARELADAVRLDPTSALAQREMGANLLSTATTQLNQGNVPAALQSLDLARNFYQRAVKLDTSDRSAQGFLGCTLIRIGTLRSDPQQTQLGLRFTSRAGQGDWSACERLAMQAPAGAPPPAPR